MNTKVIIVIQGGTLQSSFATSPEVQVELIDVDNLRAEGKCNAEIDALIEGATNELYVV